MRQDIGTVEAELRAANRQGTDQLLATLVKHHGSESIDLKEHQSRVRLLCSEIGVLKEQIGEMQSVIKRQRSVIIKLGEADDLDIPKLSEIVQTICEFYNISKACLTGPSRTYKFSLPRQILYYLARELTRVSLPEIGRKVGGRDHTTILYGVRKMEAQIAVDPALRETIDTLKMKLEAKVEARNAVIGEEKAA